MTDICVIFASEDEDVVRKFVSLLRNNWDVWWAGDITHGDYEKLILDRIKNAKAVVSVLSRHTENAKFFKDEFKYAEKHNPLIFPFFIDQVEPPLGFGYLNSTNAFGWDGEVNHHGYIELKKKIATNIEQAKKELRKGEEQGRKNVFISFAYEDIDNVNLLRGQAKNENSPIEFNDWSVSEPFDSERAPYIKQKIGERINQSSLTVVYLSDNTPNSHWVDWEIGESLRRGKHVIGVYTGDSHPINLPKSIAQNNIKCVPWSKLAETIGSLE